MVIKGLWENTIVSISLLRKEGKGYIQASTLFGSLVCVRPVGNHTQRVTTDGKSKSSLTNGVRINPERDDQNV